MLTQYFHVLPVCPAGGTYTIGPIGKQPVCSIAAHSQEAVKELIAHQSKPSFPWLVFIGRFALFGVPLFGLYFVFRRLTRSLMKTP